MPFQSINPYNQELIASHESLDDAAIENTLQRSEAAFRSWRKVPYEERAAALNKMANLLRQQKQELALTATREMGKTLAEAVSEVEKCAWVCEYYAENAASFLQDEVIKTDASKSFVRYDPIGTVLAIMPWNFPYWQVYRFAAPAVMAGNTGLLKHAPNVLGCANHMKRLFLEAGFPKGVFDTLHVEVDKMENIISDPRIKAVTLTGSGRAGRSVAALAGKHLKKTVLELGGSNGFVVLSDADLDAAIDTGMQARFMNAGQSCIAAKRFIIHKDLAEAFEERILARIKALKYGNPEDPDTDLGPLARPDLAEQLEKQVKESVKAGALLVHGGGRDGALFAPSLLKNIQPGMPAFDEELFGPVLSLMVADSDEEAIKLANSTSFGLGVSIMTGDPERALALASETEDGAVFINELVKSDPRLPFGGTKESGYGRELSHHGIREFVNAKTVYVK